MAGEQDIGTAVGGLDVESAVRLLTGAAMFELHGDESIGLAPMIFSDGPTGVRGLDFTGGRKVALLPNATLLASSWDERIAERAGQLLAEEARTQGVHVLLGPTINLHRTPLGGRLFEAYAEDPLLTGRLAAAYVRSLQSRGVGACLKHYVANEAETERQSVNSVVDERALREIYLLPFEIAVQDAHPWTVMAAYNDVNGVAATEHDELINGVLKGQWRWDGLVMSDWFATKSTVPSANGGQDLVMPGPFGPWGEQLVDAVRAGKVSEQTIREHARRLLRLAGRVGAFGDNVRKPEDNWPSPADPVRREELRSLAAAGMTLLKNDNDILPLSEIPLVIGRHAVRTVAQGAGSAGVRPPHLVNIADGLVAALDDIRVLDGVEVRERPDIAEPGFVRDPETGEPGIRITSWRTDGEEQASTTSEIGEIALGMTTGPHEGAVSVELCAELDAGEVEVGVRGVGAWTVEIDGVRHEFALDNVSGDLGAAILDPPAWTSVVRARPGSRLTARLDTSGGVLTKAGLVARPAIRPTAEVIADAAAAAKDAPVAVVVVGLTVEQETEGVDKTTLALPGAQDELVRAVADVARRTVVVVNAASPILMPWLEKVDAVLYAGLPGQEGGHAVADVLLGRREPTGRLVTTFPAADGEGPAWSPVPTDGVLEYREGVRVGYRGWHGGGQKPLFWFGHGLGWTTWTYHTVQVDGDHVVVELENSGSRVGGEVVQAYVQPEGETVRLAGWSVVDAVPPGERRTVTVELDPRVLRVWRDGWKPVSGGEILVARGLGDVRLRTAF
ncbi:beta-glucosidase [Fodinicola acaciae]|uniref:beta-glucosidase n=1 Tax=Fodinicola acaciae TaxID=2681555 RepID=UPI0013D6D7A5|nr:glycoside hydrolase family 3 C-terminal domain-containing protein [Fodinicola acaciae]